MDRPKKIMQICTKMAGSCGIQEVGDLKGMLAAAEKTKLASAKPIAEVANEGPKPAYHVTKIVATMNVMKTCLEPNTLSNPSRIPKAIATASTANP